MVDKELEELIMEIEPENGKKTSSGTYLWEIESVVEKKRTKGILNWPSFDTVEEIKITDYAKRFGEMSYYEDEDCCSVDWSPIYKAIVAMHQNDSSLGLSWVKYPDWLPMKYRPSLVELQWGDDISVDGDYGLGDFPHLDVDKPLGVFVLPPLPYGGSKNYPSKREKYPLMDSVLKEAEKKQIKEFGKQSLLGRMVKKRGNFLESHYDFFERLYEMQGHAGGEIVRVEYIPEGVLKPHLYEESNAINTWIRPAVKVLFLDLDRGYVPTHETVWIFPARHYFEHEGGIYDWNTNDITWYGMMIKMFAPSEEAWLKWVEEI